MRPLPSTQSPTTTTYPASRSQSTQKPSRSTPAPSTPSDAAVTPIVSPCRNRAGKRTMSTILVTHPAGRHNTPRFERAAAKDAPTEAPSKARL